MSIHRFPGPHRAPRVLLAALAFATFAKSANAALFDDEEARRRIESTNQRLSAVQRAQTGNVYQRSLKLRSGIWWQPLLSPMSCSRFKNDSRTSDIS
jgi:hypothetical protein